MISPGAISMPAIFTGTCTACTACGPCPAQIPRVRYWNFIGRISWMSREGPFDTAPIAPHARIEEVMLPPDRPTLSAMSPGNFCSKQKMDGLPSLSIASSTFIRVRLLNVGSGRPYVHVTAYPAIGPISGYQHESVLFVYQF